MAKKQFESPVTRLYAGKTVLITGATGCVGKVLLEKLLYTCHDVRRVYVIIRQKNGLNSAQRLEDFVKSSVFAGPNRIAQNVLREKIVTMYGDLTLEGLGLSEQDRDIVINEVDIVLHCAASVRFDDPIKEALKINFLGTRSLVQLANEMSKIQAFVHVSTCYSNCQLDVVEEKVYLTKISGDALVELSKWIDSDELDMMAAETFYEGRPNSYTFTKALAENYVHEHSKCPTAIARLSIVTPSVSEPVVGFTDTAGAANFIFVAQMLGALRTFEYNVHCVSDYVPVDFVARALLVIGHEAAMVQSRETMVYNVCAGSSQTLRQNALFESGDIIFKDTVPLKSFRAVASLTRPPSKFEYLYKKYVHELLFALLVDLVLVVAGCKSFALEKMKSASSIRDALQPFARKTFKFENENFRALAERMDPSDCELFNFDVKVLFDGLNKHEIYTEYARAGCLSYMRYKLDDLPSPADAASRKRHMRMLKVREIFCQVAILGLLIILIYGLFAALRFAFVTLVDVYRRNELK